MERNRFYFVLIIFMIVNSYQSFAQNPFIMDQFAADPSARVFGNSVYLYPSHDIVPVESQKRPNWFCMEDYHVFSSKNLVDWTDHGVIITQYDIDWVNPDSFALWAPDCIHKNGKYYFYFPAPVKDTTNGAGFTVGVAVADNPTGPYVPQPHPIKNIRGIDPNVFIDKDGQAYLYWSSGKIFGAKLKENMLELSSKPLVIANLPEKGFKEGPFLFERNGLYYLTFPYVENEVERLEYAIGKSPMGPFEVKGVIMDESPTGCWTNHQSIIKFKNQWYLFYHHNDLSPKFDKNRSVRIDSLFFNKDGTIQKVTPTLRGVGISHATNQIQIDRYSSISDTGASVIFIDTLNTFKGWKTVLTNQNAWIQYNSVDFRKKKLKSVQVRASSPNGSTLQIRLDKMDGVLLAEIKIPKGKAWSLIKTKISKYHKGVYNLFVKSIDNNPVEIDWIQFLK